VLWQLPAFVANIASASAGRVSEESGTVTLPGSVRKVTVRLRHSEDQQPGVGSRLRAAP
jgi:hypothetical protein